MEVKKNLNNVQRKMLDEIYSEQFKSIRREVLDKREKEYHLLEAKELKAFAKDKDVKAYLEAGKKFYELRKKLEPKFQENGIGTNEYISNIPELKTSYGYGTGYNRLPALEAHKDETSRLESLFDQRKREMRAKIYGLNATYEEAEAELKELLKDLI